jgi:superfamily II DNA or RNA helicase
MKLIIQNSYCTIEDMTLHVYQELKLRMVYQSENDYHRGYFNKQYLITKRGEFPTGLLNIFLDYIKRKNIPVKIVDQRVKPKSSLELNFNLGFAPYKEQMDASQIALMKHRGIISMPTGTGKSAVIALIINKLKVPTLIVVPSLELKSQLGNSLKQIFGVNHHIRVENVDALNPDETYNYDCLIIDEYHHSAAKTYRKLNKQAWSGIYYRFGLTATPFRNKSEENILLKSILSDIIYQLDYKTASKKGYITPVEGYFITVPPKRHVEGFTWQEVYKELVVNNTVRNRLIERLIQNLKNEPTICLVKELDHGNQISTFTKVPFVNGQDNSSRIGIDLFNTGRIKQIIGTTGVLGEGVDTKPAEYIIIAGLGKSKNQFMQNVGRGVRTYPNKESCKVIIFKDTSHKWTKKHFAEQVKILKTEYGCIPVEIVLDDD